MIFLACAAILISVGGVVAVWRLKLTTERAVVSERAGAVDRLMASSHHRRAVITLHNGEGFDGVIADVDDLTVCLSNARHFVDQQTEPVGIDGDLLLPRSDILYLQRP